MSSVKNPMSTGYKAVFVLSILMIFVVIIGGAMNGSKSVGFGVWYWGYTAWKMYKRDNDSLVSIQKVMLWFEAIAFSLALGVLLLSDSDVRRYVDITPLGLIILASLSIGATYLLYKFFKTQQFAPATFAAVSSSSIEDRFWEKASRELEGDRHEATWARTLASADGDEPKAKARYIKIRAEAHHRSSLNSHEFTVNVAANPVTVADKFENNKQPSKEALSPWESFGVLGKTVTIVILLWFIVALILA
jgi:hypothetical protein